jgi:hypothetical protein
VRQGEVGLEFFILFSGSVNVEVDGKVCATINTGETFGAKVSCSLIQWIFQYYVLVLCTSTMYYVDTRTTP